MKLLKYIALSSVLALSMSSCTDWLDVNVDPDQPNNQSILIQNRAPWILKQHTYSAGCANTRCFVIGGGFYSNNGNMNNVSVTQNAADAAGLTTTPYQTWFVGVGSNTVDLYDRAKAEGAYHYMAVARVIQAMGFMEFLDIYGEIPFTEALGASPAPAYSNGKEIFYGCMEKIDEAIELFGKTQEAGAQPLSAGDIWNGGDVQKWIKLCYGLKARWLLKLSKKAEFNADEILNCLAKAPQNNNDDTKMACYDVLGDQTDFLLGDPIYTNGNWDTAAYGKTQWVSKYYYDLLTNMRGAGVVDPRMPKIVPASMTNVTLNAAGQVNTYEWRRTQGVDIYGAAERLVAGGPTSIQVQTFMTQDAYDAKDKEGWLTSIKKYTIEDAAAKAKFVSDLKANKYTEVNIEKLDTATQKNILGHQFAVIGDVVAVRYAPGQWYVNNTNYIHAGDTIYGNLCGGSVNTNNGSWGMKEKDTYYHSNDKAAAVAGAVSGTGSFQIRANSDFDVLTYYEMCFIKAEVLFRKGDKGGALAAYKAGIQANMDRMQAKLQQWKSEGYDNPDMWPMDAAEISAYMNSNAVCQGAGSLTMADIMQQKYVAMGWSIENYNDMRRFNFSAGNVADFGQVYPDIFRSKVFSGASAFKSDDPKNVQYWIRRWRLPATLELKYNTNNALAANANALQDWVWCIPVWWDCATDAEYESYLK